MDPFRSRFSSSAEAEDLTRDDGFTKRTEPVPFRRNNDAKDETKNLAFWSLSAFKLDHQDPAMWTRKPPHHLPPIDQGAFKKNTSKTSRLCKEKATKMMRKTLPDIERSAFTEKEYVRLETSEPIRHGGEKSDFDENSIVESQREDSRCIEKHIQERFVTQDAKNRPTHTGRRRRFKPASSLTHGIDEARFKVPFPPEIAQSDGIQNEHHESHSKGSVYRGAGTNAVLLEALFHPAPRPVVQNTSNSCHEVTLKGDKCFTQENIMQKLATNDCEKRPSDTGRRRRFKPASSLDLSNGIREVHLKIPFPPISAQNDGIQDDQRRLQPSGRMNGVNVSRGFGIDATHSEVPPLHPRPRQSGEVQNYSECRFGVPLKDQKSVTCIHERFQNKLLVNGDGDKRPSDTERRRRFRPASTVTDVSNATDESDRTVTLPPITDELQNNQPRPHPSRRMRRVAVCSNDEAAALVKERTRARVLLKKFGKLPISKN